MEIGIEIDLAYVAFGHLRRGYGEGDPLVLARQLIGGVHLLVAGATERRLVGATEHLCLRRLARVALNLHRRQQFRPRYNLERTKTDCRRWKIFLEKREDWSGRSSEGLCERGEWEFHVRRFIYS